MTVLTGETLAQLNAGVSLPRYDRRQFTTGIVHLAPQLRAAAQRRRCHPTAFLEDNRAVFGELADDTRFTQVYRSILTSLFEHGVRRTFTDLDHYATPSMAGRNPVGLERKSP